MLGPATGPVHESRSLWEPPNLLRPEVCPLSLGEPVHPPMFALPCGCEPSSSPPYIRYCARHDPDRVKRLEALCNDILTRAQGVAGKLDGTAGSLFPRYAQVSAGDAMEDLLEEFTPRFQRLMDFGPVLPGAGTLQLPEGLPSPDA
jgi:hypothetical protein